MNADWRDDVPCVGKTALFFANGYEPFDPARALAICEPCEHKRECLALRGRKDDGVWGGLYFPMKREPMRIERRTA